MKNNNSNHRLALFIAYLALFMATLGISIGYKHWLRIHDKAKEALVQIETVKAEIRALKRANVDSPNKGLVETQVMIDNALKQLRDIQQQTHYSAQVVKQQVKELNILHYQANKVTMDNSRLLMTALHLLESAQWQLHYFYNKESALALLKRADTLLMQIGSKEQITIREKLLHDITQLEQYVIPKFDDVSIRITQLQKSITPLATLYRDKEIGKKVTLFTKKNDNGAINKVKNYINQSVNITKYDELANSSISQADRQRIDLLLTLHFESLKLQLILHQKEGFKQQAVLIYKLVQQYYPKTVSQQWLQKLSTLIQLNITPELPVITSALTSLKAQAEIAQ